LIPELRSRFNYEFTPEQYETLLRLLEDRCGTRVEYRIAETPVFLPQELLADMATEGAELTGCCGRVGAAAGGDTGVPVGVRLPGRP